MKTVAGVCLVLLPGMMGLAAWGLPMAVSEDTLQVCGVVWLCSLALLGTLQLRDVLRGWE
jgi:hypothetical protein